MSERYTRKDVEAQFERFVKVIGGRVATSYDDEGAYILDHNGTYGGYNIMRLVETGGGQTHVCGAMRRGPTAMIETLSFAIDAIEERERFRYEREKLASDQGYINPNRVSASGDDFVTGVDR